MTTQPKPRLTSRSLPVVSLDEELPAARRARLASGEVVEQHPSPTPGPVGDDFADAFMQEWLSNTRQTRSQPSLAPSTALPTSQPASLPSSPHSGSGAVPTGSEDTDPLAALLETGDTHLASEVSRIEGTVFAIEDDVDLWSEVQQTAADDLALQAQVEEERFKERFEQRLEVVANPVSIEQVKAREKVARGERWFGVGLGVLIIGFIVGVVVLVWLWAAQPQTITVEPTHTEPVRIGTDPNLVKWRG